MSVDVTRLKQLLSDFSEELVSVLDEGGLCNLAKKLSTGRSDSNWEQTQKEEEYLTPEFKSELVLLSNVVEKVKESLDNNSSESAGDFQEEITDKETLPGVVVLGPPGTEPVRGARGADGGADSYVTMTRYDKRKSVVYSRVSAGAGLSPDHTPSPTQVLSIPPKDSPSVRGEVYTSIKHSHSKRPKPSRHPLAITYHKPASPSSPLSSVESPSTSLSLSEKPHLRKSQRIQGIGVESYVESASRETSCSSTTDLHSPMSNPPQSHDNHLPFEGSTHVEHVNGINHPTVSASPTSKKFEVGSTFLSNTKKDLLQISTDENFSDEDVEGGGQNGLYFTSYDADPGGAIACDGEEDMMVATNVSVKTGEFPVDQASSDDNQVQQQQQQCADSAETRSDDTCSEASSFAQVRSDVQDWVNTSKNGKKGSGKPASRKIPARRDVTKLQVLKGSPAEKLVPHATPTKLKVTPTSTGTSPTQPVLGKVLQVVVPKLPHEHLNKALNKLKPSSRSSSPSVANRSTLQDVLHVPEETSIAGRLSDIDDACSPSLLQPLDECRVEEGEGGGVSKDKIVPEDVGGESGKGKARKGIKRLKKRDKTSRDLFTVMVKVEKNDPSPSPTPDTTTPGERSSPSDYHPASGRSHSSSTCDDITFSDVANNVIGNSPSSMAGSSPSFEERFSSRDPLPTHSEGSALKRAVSLTPGPNSQGIFRWGSDDDFDTTISPYPKSSHFHSGSKISTPSKKKKRKKILCRVSSDEDVKPVSLPARTSRASSDEDVKPLVLPASSQKSPRKKSAKDIGRQNGRQENPGEGEEREVRNSFSDRDLLDDGSGEPEEVAQSPLNVNIDLKYPVKLGKHCQGPHSKGKEKAKGPPDLVQCCSCGKEIDWRNQKVHAHSRLNVLTCHYCYKTWTTGQFEKVGTHEIYCSLCGDGGNTVLCDYCDKVFCEACISRISGPEHLQYLLKMESAAFCCYLCDSSPIRSKQELCIELTGYFSKSSGGRALLRSRVINNSLIGKGSAVGGVSQEDTASGSADEGGGGGGAAAATPQDSGSAKKGRAKNTSTRDSRRNGGTSMGSFSDESSSESSDSKSPELLTDDLDLSDSPLGDRKKPKVLQKRTRRGDSSDSKQENAHEVDKKQSEKVKRKKKKRRRVELYRSSISGSAEKDSSEGEETRRQRKRKALHSHSDSSTTAKKEHRKRKRLAVSLSSNSDEERTGLRLDLSSGHNSGYDSNMDQELAGGRHSGGAGGVKYRITEICTSDSSDIEPTMRRQTKKRTKGDLSTSSSGGEGKDGSKGGCGDEKGRDKSEKSGRKKQRVNRNSKKVGTAVTGNTSSEDDFMERNFHQRGPRKKQKRLHHSLLSSDSNSGSGDEIDLTGAKEEEKEEEDVGASQESTTPGKKRKKIRKVLDDAKLASETKQAQQEEKERAERLKKRKSLGEEEENRLVLEQDPESKEVKVEVRRSLVPNIKPHQKEGIKFLYDVCVESLERLSSGHKSGAILAHCMGLGKTLQVIAFADALLNCEESGVKKVLVLCPINTVNNWKMEFFKWIPFLHCDYNVYILNDTGVTARLEKLRRWFVNGGIVFMGYDLFRNLALSKGTKKKKNKEAFQKFLLDPGADIVVCDEGHVMRNSKSTLSVMVNQVKTRLRIVLTGTPLQNNLNEYYTMVNFVKPNLLGLPKEFKNRFVNPITNGQCRDSLPQDIRKMKHMSHVLHKLLKDTVQRRDFRVLAKVLPPKQEYVLKIRLSGVQDKLYRSYLDKGRGYYCASDLFSTFSTLAKVWNHPWVLKMDEHRKSEREFRTAMSADENDDDPTLGGFIVSGSEEEESVSSKSMGGQSGGRSVSVTPAPQSHPSTPINACQSPILISSDEDVPRISIKAPQVKTEQVDTEISTNITKQQTTNQRPPSSKPLPWYEEFITDSCEDELDLSGKLVFLLELLEQARQNKEKVLVFSQSLLTLDLIEEFLSKPQYGDWVPALDYYRLDGSTKADVRTANMSDFNKRGNHRLRLFLISTRAGSLGVNLVAANRVVIFDACWNPSHDLQAIFRAYRYGQDKPVFVYRLVAQGTMEEKIYDRQVTKQSLSMRVVDERQIGRHFTSSDLAELFTYTPCPPPPPPEATQEQQATKKPEEDLVLCRVLDKLQPNWVTSYHEHDSLLEHIDDEELSEEERKAAWASYNQQIETNKYDMQALQNNLLSLQGAPMAPTNAGGAIAANGGSTNVYHAFRECAERTIDLVQDLKKDSHNLRLVKMMYANSQLIPREKQEQIALLEKRCNAKYQILGDCIRTFNERTYKFTSNPLATVRPLLGSVDRQRQVLFAALEELHQITSPGAPPTSVMLPAVSSRPTIVSAPSVRVTSAPNTAISLVPAPNNNIMAAPTFPAAVVVQRPPTGPGASNQQQQQQTAPLSLPDNQVTSTTGKN